MLTSRLTLTPLLSELGFAVQYFFSAPRYEDSLGYLPRQWVSVRHWHYSQAGHQGGAPPGDYTWKSQVSSSQTCPDVRVLSFTSFWMFLLYMLHCTYCKHIFRWCSTCDIFHYLHLVVDKLDIWLPGIQNSLWSLFSGAALQLSFLHALLLWTLVPE